jgi:hypothetical protein
MMIAEVNIAIGAIDRIFPVRSPILWHCERN